MKQILFAAILLAAVSAGTWGHAASDGTIGVVRNAAGSATVTRGGTVLPATAGTRLHTGDALATGPDGSLGVILRDDSSLSLGPSSSLVLRDFLFSPSEGKFSLLVRLSKGTMAYLSGLIGKLAPEKARFETPTATIGIRGTHFAVMAGEPVSQ
ncbi:MAG TPA: FecR domain-containing protein [Candidatus Deferrimicrobium sp.]